MQRKLGVSVNDGVGASSSKVAQLKWLAQGKDLLWDRLIGGLEWHYSRDAEAFWYHINVDTDVPYDRWREIEANEGELLTEEALDRLGFQELQVEEGENVVEYVPPQPEFAPVEDSMITPMGERELVERLTKHLQYQTATRNYDRLIYINTFIRFKESNPELSDEELLARFEVHSGELVKCTQGGHCGGLSGDLLGTNYGPGAYLVASKLPAQYQQEGAPEYCHVAAMIRFQNPETAEDNGLILLEPGFNITQPIVVKAGRVTSLDQGEEIWDFSLNEAQTEIICQPRPKDSNVRWNAKKQREKKMTYRTDVFLNPDLSLTVPLLRVDGRPAILARDERGNVVAQIVINYKKAQVEIRVGEKRQATPFASVDAEGGWLGELLVPLSRLLHLAPGELVTRIHDAVTKHRPKQ